MRRTIIISVLCLVLGALSGCTRLTKWEPVVTDGSELAERGEVRLDDVIVRVWNFGVYNSWGPPAVELIIRNRGDQAVSFDPRQCQVDVADRMIGPEPGMNLEMCVLEPGRRYRERIIFDGSLSLKQPTDPDRRSLQVDPDTLVLHLPTLIIDGREHQLEPLTFRAPTFLLD